MVALSIVAATTGANVIYESSSSSSIGLSSSTEDWRTAFLRPPATAVGRLSVFAGFDLSVDRIALDQSDLFDRI